MQSTFWHIYLLRRAFGLRFFAQALACIFCLAPFAVAQNQAQCKGMHGFREALGHRTFLWHADGLQAMRVDFEKQGTAAHPAIAQLLQDANNALEEKIVKVTDKKRVGDGASSRHYHSLAPYWWPDPKFPKRPYLRRDGVVNPERDGKNYDHTRIRKMSESVSVLSLAYFITREQRYAERAATWIRTWHLDPAHSMLPNFDYAQGVPGRANGRKEGVIDARMLMPVVESIGLIENAGVFSVAERKALRDWFAELVSWLARSPLGRAERAAKNNHGIFYDLQLIHFALFAGMEDVAKIVAERFPKARLGVQMAANGSLPEELERTRSFHYSTWTAGAIFDVAALSACVLDTPHWQIAATEPSPQRALEFLAPYLDQAKPWAWTEIKKDRSELHQALYRAAFYQSDNTLWNALGESDAKRSARYRLWLYR